MAWLYLYWYSVMLNAFHVFVLYSHSTETLCTSTVLAPVLVLRWLLTIPQGTLPTCLPRPSSHAKLHVRLPTLNPISVYHTPPSSRISTPASEPLGMQNIFLGLLSSNSSLRRHPLELCAMRFLWKPFLLMPHLVDVEVGLCTSDSIRM
jgi:hypothetical protein